MRVTVTQTAAATIKSERILILDFGSQYSQLIARRVREAGVFCEMYPWDIEASRISGFGADGVILSGGPESVHAIDAPKINEAVFELGVPVLGICYGMQAMASHFGGQVQASDVHEFGAAKIEVKGGALLSGLSVDPMLDVWMSHGDKVVELPAGFEVSAATPSCPIAAMSRESDHLYGLQFHPEVTHTPQGEALISRFVHEICGLGHAWNSENIIELRVAQMREQIGSDQVLLGLSGGVDS